MKPFGIALLVVGSVALPASAGVYSTHEPFNFEIDADGFARPIQYSGGFEIILKDLRQAASLPRTPSEPVNAVRQAYLARIDQRKQKGIADLAPGELATYTADLLRVGRANDALNYLQPIVRDPRRGGFLAATHLAAAHSARGEWREAADQQQQALLSGFPEAFGKLTKPQLAWLKRVERDYYLPLLVRRADEARTTRPQDRRREATDDLFARKGQDSVHFVDDTGQFVPGQIAAKERAKLPKDALAIVQQLVLWHPHDARLFWLLGELYNAEGDVETAAAILDECSYAMGYTNPNLMHHRQSLKEAAAALAAQRADDAEKARLAAEAERQQEEAEKQQRELDERNYQKRFWWIVAIAVALGVTLAYYQFREVARRMRR